MIKEQFIDHHVVIHRKQLKKLLFDIWQSLDPYQRFGRSDKHFMSYKFIKGFCRRNRITFRQMRGKKRNDIPDFEDRDYIKDIKEIFNIFKEDHIYNMDETPWNFVFKRGQVLGHCRTESVDAWLPDDYKKTFTCVATVNASGTKPHLYSKLTGKHMFPSNNGYLYY